MQKKITAGKQRLIIYDVPVMVDEDPMPLPIASYKKIGNATTNSNVVLAITGDFDSDSVIDDIGLIRQNMTTGKQRLIIYDAPVIVGEDPMPSPIASYKKIGNATTNNNVIQASGIN